ncbi:MAG: exo-alpha-sialidase [Bacteroidales bacterium]|nr:exo-alpha-sialidase [Bacteroidales bacterium]
MRKFLYVIAVLSASFLSAAQDYRPNLPWADISGQTERHVIIARGTPDLYNGHPTTLLLEDGKTMLCTWSKGHGGVAAFIGFSHDSGLTWDVQDAPKEWEGLVNCPSIYQMEDKSGKKRIFVFATVSSGRPYRDMGYSCSDDGGRTWSRVKILGKPCVMAFTSIVRLKNGDYLGLYHSRGDEKYPLKLWQAVSHDGGLNWDESTLVGEYAGKSPCEPCGFYSPDGKTILCLARENQRKGCALMMTSKDEGKTWSPLTETPWGLTGDRHQALYLPDGRIISVFRDMALNSPTKGHFVAWVGTWADIIDGRSGQYKVKLLHSYAGPDCGYPGLELLPDGTIAATTYIKYNPGDEKHSVVSVRFKIDELDALFKK